MRMRKLPWAQDFLKEQEVVVPDASALAGAWKQTLKRAELHVEIGTGKGDYWVQMAQKYPDIAWVGVEKNINVAALAVRKYTQLEQQPDNMLYIQGDAEVIDTWFAQGEVDVIHLNFSDPWPKKRAHKKRLSNHAFIARYAHILKPDGEIQMKTDNSALFEYSLMELQEEDWRLKEVSVDYRREEHAEDVITEYERRFLEKGQPIYRAVFVKNGKEKDAPFPEK